MGQLIRKFSLIAFITSLFLCSFTSIGAEEPSEDYDLPEDFDPGEMITHHIGDAHEWHFASIGHHHYTIPLPIIIYSQNKGLEMFSSAHLAHGAKYNGFTLDEHEHLHAEDHSLHFYDLSITKNVASLFISAFLLLFVFIRIGAAYKTNRGKAPKGMQSFFEPIIIYIRDEVAKNIIGAKYERYLPYLLTVFFFIWFNNLLGLVPGGVNLTGNIAVTLFLAVLTFLITLFSANKYYWSHIFNPPGVPMLLKPLIVVIEVVGMFTKPFSLMVRLFANITAGHIIILSLLGLIFIFKHVGASLVSLPFAIFMTFLELFVALLQAYIFTLLSAMYFGSAIEEHHHPDNDHGH
jgi:F-type H+-transporting ATPase subunit a